MRHFFVERLTVWSLIGQVVPELLHGRDKACTVFYLESTPAALALSRLASFVGAFTFSPWVYALMDIRDEKGLWVRLRVVYQELLSFRQSVLAGGLLPQDFPQGLKSFLIKQITSSPLEGAEGVWRSLLFIQVVRARLRQAGFAAQDTVIFLRRRRWPAAIAHNARQYGLRVVFTAQALGHWKMALRSCWPAPMKILRSIYFSIQRRDICGLFAGLRQTLCNPLPQAAVLPNQKPVNIGVEYYGQWNIADPQKYSDIFFWQQSNILAQDILLLFHLPGDGLDARKQADIDGKGFQRVVLNPKAAALQSAPFFNHWRLSRLNLPSGIIEQAPAQEQPWLRKQISYYRSEYNYWREFFVTHNTKVYTTWHINGASHCVMGAALASLGGVMTVYQRSFHEFPAADSMISADVAFGFCDLNRQAHEKSGSIIPYHVTVGYLGDHRFPLLKAQAAALRVQLQKAGAERIVAFFDENSAGDSRWFGGHGIPRANYAFILGKLLSDKRLGLLIKPKVSNNLRMRLGPLAALLDEAIATGRCLVIGEGAFHNVYPPALAALAADIAIHGHLCAATAGVESALAGVPTVLFDPEGCPESVFNQLGAGKNVFRAWDQLWSALEDYWKVPGNPMGLGLWGDFLNEMDPFRDGQAAARMGAYLQSLLEGYKQGLPRQRILERAAEQYAQQWGGWAVKSVNT